MKRLCLLLVYLSSLVTIASAEPLLAVAKKPDKKDAAETTDTSQALDDLLAKPDVNKSVDDVLSNPIKPTERKIERRQELKFTPDDNAEPARTDNTQEFTFLEPKPAPKKSTVLQGQASASGTRLQGSASMQGQGQGLQGQADDRSPINLRAQQDPDQDDQELMVEWDRWRNRFLRAVQAQVQAEINNPDSDTYIRPRFDPRTGYIQPRFPLGTVAWFYAEIGADGRVRKLSITEPSGIREYDRAIVDGIRALEGTSLLQFPHKSKRPFVVQEAGIKTSTSADYQYHHFGDVERYREPR